MDFWIDVFSSWDNFLTFIGVVILFYGGAWVLNKIWGRLTQQKKPSSEYRSSNLRKERKPDDPITTKVVGVTFDGRQNVIRRLRIGEMLELEREPDNPHDPNAVKVIRKTGEQIGYLNRELAKDVSWFFDVSIFPRPAKVVKIIGDLSKGQSLGVIIEVWPPSQAEALVSIDRLYPVPPFGGPSKIPESSDIPGKPKIEATIRRSPLLQHSSDKESISEKKIPKRRALERVARVLIVDDIADVRVRIRKILESVDDIVVVGEASNGFEAIEKYEELQPDVVSMNVSMPKMNGIKATQIIKQQFKDAKIFMLTVHSDADYMHRAMQAGAADWILKPPDEFEYIETIRRLASLS